MATIPIKNINRDPVQNWQVDPSRNWRIDPSRNWRIDPARNWRINPARNWQINPARNWQINPARNWQINPARNWQINPTRNWQIDPIRNWLIDPFRSNNIEGFYVFSSTNNECQYFTVKATDQDILLFFNANKDFCFFAVGACGVYSVFSVEHFSYDGYLCSNGFGGYNGFTSDGLWNRYLL